MREPSKSIHPVGCFTLLKAFRNPSWAIRCSFFDEKLTSISKLKLITTPWQWKTFLAWWQNSQSQNVTILENEKTQIFKQNFGKYWFWDVTSKNMSFLQFGLSCGPWRVCVKTKSLKSCDSALTVQCCALKKPNSVRRDWSVKVTKRLTHPKGWVL